MIWHALMIPGTSDDKASLELVKNYSWLEWIVFRYNSWSARFIQEGIGYFMIKHLQLWKVIDSIIFILLPFLFMYLLDAEKDEKIICFILPLIFPIRDLCTAGWVCTTNTYLWSAFFGILSCCFLKSAFINKNISWYKWIILFIVWLVACDHELMAVIIFVIIMFMIFNYYHHYKKILFGYIICAVLNISNIIFILVSPGNHNRALIEADVHFSGYQDFGFLDKIILGITRTVKILFISNNSAFIFFIVILMLAAILNSNNVFVWICGFIPLIVKYIFLTILYGYYIEDITSINYSSKYTYIPLILGITVLIASSVVIYEILKKHYDNVFAGFGVILLFVGISTTTVMGFSPTIYVSSARTSTFTYFVIIYLSGLLYTSIKSKNEKILLCKYYITSFLLFTVYIADLIVIYLLRK